MPVLWSYTVAWQELSLGNSGKNVSGSYLLVETKLSPKSSWMGLSSATTRFPKRFTCGISCWAVSLGSVARLEMTYFPGTGPLVSEVGLMRKSPAIGQCGACANWMIALLQARRQDVDHPNSDVSCRQETTRVSHTCTCMNRMSELHTVRENQIARKLCLFVT